MEPAVRTQEEAEFLNLANASFVSISDYNHTAGGSYSIRLSGNSQEVVGPARSFVVQEGDHFELEVYAKYEETGGGSPGLSSLFPTLANTFSLNPFVSGGLEGSEAFYALDNLFDAGIYIGDEEPYEDANAPKAYLNYILFDNSFNLVDFGYDQVANGATTTHDLLSLKLKITQPGYLYVYLSNENNTPRNVYFDDFKIKYTHIDVIQATDYYAFGMDIKGTAYNKPNAFKNQFKYNGMEAQDELDLGLYDYGARMYMPDIGRWGVLDPLAEKDYGWSPYKYAYNNPLLFIDPDGKGEVYGMSTASLAQTGSVSTVFQSAVWNPYGGAEVGRESVQNGVNIYYSGEWIGGSGVVSPYGIMASGGSDPGISAETNLAFQYGLSAWNARQRNERRNARTGSFIKNLGQGLWDGGKSIVSSTWDLATLDGDAWSEFGQGLLTLSELASPIPNYTKIAVETQVINYAQNIPDMSWSDWGYDLGRGGAAVGAFVLTRRLPGALSSIGKFRPIRNGFIVTNENRLIFRAQFGRDSINPIAGRGAIGAIKASHINIQIGNFNTHTFFNPFKWKYLSSNPYLPFRWSKP